MTFLAPLLLSLAAFAGVPLLVHLLRRRVTRRVEFPAVRFLLQTEREHSRERTVRNRLLLLLRLLAVLALVAAVARPIASIGGSGHPPLAVAIVLDQSMSTRAVVNGETVFSGLQSVARDVAGRLSTNDRAWLVTSGGVVVAGDGPALQLAIDALEPSAGRGDLGGAMVRARALVDAGAPRTPVIAVISDGQRSALDSTMAVEGVAVVVYAPKLPETNNRAVHTVAVEPARWVPNGRVTATLSGADSVAWRVFLGDRTAARGTLAPAAFDEPRLLDVAAQASDTGWIVGRVETDADDFPGDNSRVFALLAGAPPAVAVRSSAGAFVEAAVDALVADNRLRRSTGTVPPGASATVVTIASAADAVDGPAVRLAPSDPLQIVAANRALERAGIPWRFGAALRDTVMVVDVARSETTAPVPARDAGDAAPTARATSEGLDGVRVMLRYQLSRVALNGVTDSGQVLAVSGGAPWMVAGDDYVLVASPLTLAATNAPVQAAFVPWLRDVVGQRLGDGGLAIEAAPDDTMLLPFAADTLEAADGVRTGIDATRLVVPSEPGVYMLRRGTRRIGALVVNPEIVESNRTAWEDADWRALVVDAPVLHVSEPAQTADAVYDRAGGRSIAWPLVLLALLALVAEALVARGVFASHDPVTAAR